MKGRAKREREFRREWGDLSRYNDEVYHGIVHTPEYDIKMAAKQERYNHESTDYIKGLKRK
jgi:hypothetical protein